MDSFNIINLKSEKSKSILRYRRLRFSITTLFRFMELSFLLVIISNLSLQLSSSFKFSGECFRRFTASLFSPRFVFLVGNAIVAVLFLRSGWFSEAGNKPAADLSAYCVGNRVSESEYEMKEEDTVKVETDNYKEKKISRSKSENLERKGGGEKPPPRQLRRSETEIVRKIPPAVNSYAEEEMSGDEFRRKVEAFIARQQRFLREEEFPDMAG